MLGIDNNYINHNLNNFNVFQGFFYISNFFSKINLILPTSIYIEQISSYINLEGRFRYTNKAITPYKFIFIDQNIIKSFSIFLYKFYSSYFSIFYNYNNILYFLKNIICYYKNYLININNYLLLYERDLFLIKSINFNLYFNFFVNKVFNTIFSKTIYNFYISDIFSKKSKIMILASKKIQNINFI